MAVTGDGSGSRVKTKFPLFSSPCFHWKFQPRNLAYWRPVKPYFSIVLSVSLTSFFSTSSAIHLAPLPLYLWAHLAPGLPPHRATHYSLARKYYQLPRSPPQSISSPSSSTYTVLQITHPPEKNTNHPYHHPNPPPLPPHLIQVPRLTFFFSLPPALAGDAESPLKARVTRSRKAEKRINAMRRGLWT